LYRKNQVVIPEEKELIQMLLKEFHNSPIRGHAGIKRTTTRIASQFYWPSLKNDVNNFVQSCDIC